MRATTMVFLAASLLTGGMLIAAITSVDETAVGGGVTPAPGDAPLDEIIAESLRHADAADAAIADGWLGKDSGPYPTFDSLGDFKEAAIIDSPSWQPPHHDLPRGAYYDPKTLLIVGSHWVYEWRQGQPETEPMDRVVTQYGSVPEASMGYLDGDHFVRWAAGGWMPNDIDGDQHARRRTRLYRNGDDVCLDAGCDRRLRFASIRSRKPSSLERLLAHNVSPMMHSAYVDDLVVTTRSVERPRSAMVLDLSFSITWIDEHRCHAWGNIHNRCKHLPPPHPSTLRQGWPPVSPEQLHCICANGTCAHDDRSMHVVAAMEIERTGLPFARGAWRCDRPNAKRRWPLKALGLAGEAVLQRGENGYPRLKLPPPYGTVGMAHLSPSEFDVLDDAGKLQWKFFGENDGTLHVVTHRNRPDDAVVIHPTP